ncbi:N-arachidonyl glycine receptor [Antechinus flavipes]|uniref:N-arachidonyl glycine receptor n=1 Tax=Sarcophilus harrisii TaxID=9305 RepID=G3WFL3_SARHA|nr:N-arachidonyl glycine receptor [Sarcophilus harrisii]XP_031814481.1 N-arachidonyl glycine receptor [Sarcophilus harrisii]XP_051840025.1 N-arachidonyl glycine receptor [Antechinus flavipes]
MAIQNNQNHSVSINLQPEEYKIAALVFYSCIFIIGLFVNVTALWVFSCSTKKRTTVTIYMMNVALLDIVFILCLPFRMIYYGKGKWQFGETFCHILGALTMFYPSIALWLLAFISADRYMAILQPKHTKELKNTSKAVLACVGIWIMTLAITTPLLFLNEDPDKDTNPASCLKILDIIHLKAMNMLNFTRLIFFFLIPLFIMIGCYSFIINSLLRGRTSKLKPKVKEKSIRIIITLIVQVLVCFVPFHICFTLLMLQRGENSYNPWSTFTTFLMNLSTCLDVILYYIVSKQFQARVISVMLYRNYLRSVRRKSFRSGSIRSLSNINSEMI